MFTDDQIHEEDYRQFFPLMFCAGCEMQFGTSSCKKSKSKSKNLEKELDCKHQGNSWKHYLVNVCNGCADELYKNRAILKSQDLSKLEKVTTPPKTHLQKNQPMKMRPTLMKL
jgi:hypothetical protein